MNTRSEVLGMATVIIASYFFAAVFLLLPVYVLMEYGFASGPIYNKSGVVQGHINYFLVAFVMAVFAEALCWVIGRAATRRLRELRA